MAETKEKKYVSDNAQLMAEWDWEKNNALGFNPQILTQGCHTKVWWICPKGHSYDAQIKNRVVGNGCSYCAGKKVLKGYNDLETFYPEVASEWIYQKNGDLTPTTVAFASNKKVWWACKNCGGEYEAIIANRTLRESSCPYCAGQKVLVGYNDLQTLSPDLAAEWSDKNIEKPTEFTMFSKKRVYWTCPLGHKDYPMSIQQRSNRQGCPICAQQSQTSFPEQAIYYYLKQAFPDTVNRYIFDGREIDIFIPSKNIGVEYNGYFSHKKKAEKDILKKAFFESVGITVFVVKEYKYNEEKKQADFYIHERTAFNDLNCLIKNILGFLNVDISIDVDCSRDAIIIKNQYVSLRKENSIAAIRPDLVSRWDYEKNGNITPEMVTFGTGQRFYWKCKICNRSYLALPSKIAEGSVCSKHRNLLKKEGNDLVSKHPELLKYWDYKKNDVDPSEIYGGGERVVYWICEKGHSYTKSIIKHIRGEGCPICAGKKVLVGFNDLATVCPDVAKSWNYTKNGEALPTHITAHSNKKFWWICEHGHEWEAKVCNRANGRGCPECYKEQKGKREINMYDADTFAFIATFDSVKAVCDYLRLDNKKMNGTISRVCRREQKTLMKKYILRNTDDDEFTSLIPARNKDEKQRCNQMTKEKLLMLAENLYEEAFEANSYWEILQLINDSLEEYIDEINVSTCFYHVTYNALLHALFMSLSKLYDEDGISLRNILKAINPSNMEKDVFDILSTNKVNHQVISFDAWQFKKEVETHNLIKTTYKLNHIQEYPIVKLDYNDYYEYLKKQFDSCSKVIKRLRQQRNNFYAHNGKEYDNFDYNSLFKKYPIKKDDIDKLIQYALNITTFLIEKLSGIAKPETSIDIDDLKTTLRLVRKGKKTIED